MTGALVIADITGGQLSAATAEAVTAAAAIDGPIVLAVPRTPALTDAIITGFAGVDHLITLDVASADWDSLAEGVLALVDELSPSLVIAPHSSQGLAVLPLIAAQRDRALVTDVIGLTGSSDAVVATKSVMSGRVLVDVQADLPAAVTVRAGSFDAAEPVQVAINERSIAASGRITHGGLTQPESTGVDITQAGFILSVGRGVGDEDGLATFSDLADKLGATLGVSRPVVDAGWVKSDRQVGLSGKTVAPKVYLAFGISGAVQHLAGIRGAETVIAVNSDANAPIFSVAQYGVVCDMFDLAEELEKQSP